jgi:hypothetical protein
VVDVAYGVGSDRAAATEARLAELGLRPGVLGLGTTVGWRGPAPQDPRLRSALAAPLPADPRAIPRLLVVDDQSPPEVLAPAIANELAAAIAQGRESVTLDALIEAACWGWARFARGFQGQLRRRVREMLRDAHRQELHDLIHIERQSQQTGEAIRLTPPLAAAVTQAGSLREARAVRNRLDAWTARVTGRPIPPSPGQLTFEQLDEATVPGDEDD